MATIWRVLTRKKVLDEGSVEETRLSRVLNTYDLTALGVGSTLGVGVYVLAGNVAKDTAGPSVILSFLIAAVASLFAALCYAEFGARVPKAGSAYIYSYVCVGEFVAFVIGWNLILEYVIGSASVARGLSLYLDKLLNNTMQNAFIEVAPMHIPYLSKYFDFFACSISILLAVALALGIKESSFVNNIVTILNIFVILFVIIAGSIKADIANWEVDPTKVINGTHIGKGGFFPFGIEGMIKGAATCFYGFVGFDCIATTGEEVRNPKRAIPLSIMLSLFIIFLAYFGTSTVVTLMIPYYEQNSNAPIPHAFEAVNWNVAKWIVSVGAIFGLCASLFGAMFPLPRVIYAMAEDSLVFRFLGHVHPRFQTPVVGTLLAGILTGLMAALFDLKQLVDMMSIGTLLAYTIVAASVLILRYSVEIRTPYLLLQSSDSEDEMYSEDKTIPATESIETSDLLTYEDNDGLMGHIFNCGRRSQPTKLSEKIAAIDLSVYCVMCIFIGLCAIYMKEPIANGEAWAISLTSLVVLLAAIVIMSLVTQPTSRKELSFKVPGVPLIPALSILTNIYLMLMLDTHTWIRFAVWMAVGLPIYYFSHKPHTEAQKKAVILSNDKKNGVANGISQCYLNTGYEDTEKVPEGSPNGNSNHITSEIEQELEKLDEMLNKVDCMPREISVESGLCSAFCVETHSVHDLNQSSTIPATLFSVGGENVNNQIQIIAEIEPNKDENREHSTVVGEVESQKNETSVVEGTKIEHNNKGLEDLDKIDIVQDQEDSYEASESTVEESEPVFDNFDKTGEKTDCATETQHNESTKNDGEVGNIEPSEPITVACKPEESNNSKTDSSQKTSEKSTNDPETSDNAILDDLYIKRPNGITDESIKNTNVTNQESIDQTVPNIATSKPCTDASEPDFHEEISNTSTKANRTLKGTSLPSTMDIQEWNDDTPVQLRDKSPAPSLEPDEENLKVGSPKYKVFLDNLNEKLSRYTVIPTYVPYNGKPKRVEDEDQQNALEKDDMKTNENVLEESINTAVAREKLLAFINAGHSSPGTFRKQDVTNFDFSGENNASIDDGVAGLDASTMGKQEDAADNSNSDKDTSNDLESFRADSEGAKVDSIDDVTDHYLLHKNRMQSIFRSVNLKRKDSIDPDRNEFKANTVASINSDKRKEHVSEIFKNDTRNISENNPYEIDRDDQKDIDDYAVHKTRMQNVFRSVNLKRKDSSDTEKSESRIKSKTISLSNDDKMKHRQAMNDIFKTINMNRKGSTDLND